MPPKVRTTREMIVQAGLDVVRDEGPGALTMRAVAARLGCSTQPVLSNFPTSAQLKAAVYERADELHTAYIMQAEPGAENPLLSVGLRYVRFAKEEPNLFKLLFQSDGLGSTSLAGLVAADELTPIVSFIAAEAGVDEDAAREAFACIELVAHGYASFLANNSMDYDESFCARSLEAAFVGIVCMERGDL